MELDTTSHITLVLGSDLQLVVVDTNAKGWQRYAIRALTGEGVELGALALSRDLPTDALITAARSTALYLFPDRVMVRPTIEEIAKENVATERRQTRPHAYERDRTATRGVFRCKHCDLAPHDVVHNVKKDTER